MTPAVFREIPRLFRERVASREKLGSILTNVGWLFADQILRMGVGLVVIVWLARYLGSEQFGLVSYATAFVALFATFSTLGIPAIVVRDLVTEPACAAETLGTAFVLRLIGAGVTFSLAVGAIFLLGSDTLTRNAVAIIAASSFFQAFDTIDYWFQSQVQSKYTVVAKNFAFLSLALVKVVLLFAKAPLLAFVIATLGESLLGAIGLVILYHNNGGRLKAWRVRLTRVKQLLANGWQLMLSGMMIMLYMRIDQIMLGQMTSKHEVGIYSAAVKLSELWYFIPTAIVSSVFPAIISAKKIDAEVYRKRMQQLLNAMVLLGYLVAIPMTFLSNQVVSLVFGSQFVEAGPSLMVLSWAGLFVAIGVARETWLVTEGLMKFSLMNTALGAAINIALNFVLIPRYGATGAAFATVVSYAASAFASGFLSRRTRSVAIMTLNALIFRSLFNRRIVEAPLVA